MQTLKKLRNLKRLAVHLHSMLLLLVQLALVLVELSPKRRFLGLDEVFVLLKRLQFIIQSLLLLSQQLELGVQTLFFGNELAQLICALRVSFLLFAAMHFYLEHS